MSDAVTKSIAVFDFDGTLIKGDSLWPFLTAVAGWPRCISAVVEVFIAWVRERPTGDQRTFIKSRLLMALLAGRRVAEMDAARQKICRWAAWLEPTVQALREHKAAGRTIVVASGGLDLYLPELLKAVPCDVLICTQMEIKDGIATGAMISGNCVRQRKAELVGDYIAANGPFALSWGYGNYPHDIPMLNLLQHRVII